MSTYHTNLRRGALFLLLILSCGSARAQRFEYFSINGAQNDDGRFGVTVLSSGNGYAAVGTSDATACGVNTDVLVTQIGLKGGSPAGWPMTYDIGGACGNDIGKCIIEYKITGAGDLIIVGETAMATSCGAILPSSFLMSITSGGALNWARIYPGVLAERVVEATIGNGTTTNPGDLIFCGTTVADLPFIARTTSTGTLIWNQTYTGGNGYSGSFSDVIECTVGGSGDVAAAGTIDGFAAMLRTDGNTGIVGSAVPHGLGLYGNQCDVKLTSLQELQTAPNNGDLVAVGYTSTPIIYVIETNASPCTFVNDATFTAGFEDQAWGVREIIPSAASTLTAGDLVVVGYTRVTAASRPDAVLLQLSPSTLTPAGFGSHIYDGGGAGATDIGYSVMPVYQTVVAPPPLPADGFILCGVTDQSSVGIGTEMYIVKTDASGMEGNGCDDGGAGFSPGTLGYAPTCLAVMITQPMFDRASTVSATTVSWALNCFSFPRPASGVPLFHDNLMISSTPNPTRGGNDAALAITATSATPAIVKVADIAGGIIATFERSLPAGASELHVSTKGWARGTYIVTITAGDRTAMTRIVVE